MDFTLFGLLCHRMMERENDSGNLLLDGMACGAALSQYERSFKRMQRIQIGSDEASECEWRSGGAEELVFDSLVLDAEMSAARLKSADQSTKVRLALDAVHCSSRFRADSTRLGCVCDINKLTLAN